MRCGNSKVLVVIPVYGHYDYAEKAIFSSLNNTTENTYVLVVDDASPEDPVDFIKNITNERVIYHRWEKNKGMTAGWNRGVNIAISLGCDFVVLTNSDVIFPSGWFGPIQKALDRGWDLVGPTTNAPGSVPLQGIENYQPDRVVHSHINGFCMVGRPSFFARNEYFDEDKYPMEGNEDDFINRLTDKSGIGIVYDSFVWHFRSVTRQNKRA